VAQLYLLTDRSEIERRRKLLGPEEVLEVWEVLHGPDVSWLGDPELRRIAYQRGGATPSPGFFWVGESTKAALDRVGAPLPHVMAISEASVPVYYGPSLRDTESLPAEESLRARVLSARGIAVVWATYDRTGARLDYQPADPLDPVFYLRRARTRAIHGWRLFRTRVEAARHAAEILREDEDARRWAESIPVADFDDLVRRFGGSRSV
jgi:hypothetical protein